MGDPMSSPFVRKLRREIARSPKKAALLALLAAVGLWFWAPLVANWFSGSPPESKDMPMSKAAATNPLPAGTGMAPAAPVLPTSSAGATPQTAKPKAAQHPWRQVVRWMEQDPRTTSTTELAQWRNPFGPSAAELAAAKKEKERLAREQKSKAAQSSELGPADAGLVLTSTIVGGKQGSALISGETYRQGSMVPAAHGSTEFELLEIQPRKVILQREGKKFTLEIKEIELLSHAR